MILSRSISNCCNIVTLLLVILIVNLYCFCFQKNVSEAFERKVQIKNLPPMYRTNRQKTPSILETGASDIGLCSLFSPKAANGD